MKILYLEDNPGDADLARRELARVAPEFQLTIVPRVADAVARLKAFEESFQLGEPPLFDAVLCDVNLPDGSGLAVLAHARSRALALPVVVLTGRPPSVTTAKSNVGSPSRLRSTPKTSQTTPSSKAAIPA